MRRAHVVIQDVEHPTALVNADLAVARHGALGRRWLDAMWDGDPLADAVVADGETRRLRAVLAGSEVLQDDAPDSLRALLAAVGTDPDWLDRDACDRAADHLTRQTREFGLVLAAASLLAGATNHVAGKPLAFTGRYASNAAVRSLEVAAWLTPVTTRGGLLPSAPGFERTVRVRMIHALIRHRLDRDPEWDHAAWGLPIPQPFMAFTLAEFCSVALKAMHKLGVRFSDRETADILHLWRYVGHLIGVAPDLTPITMADYDAIEDLYMLTSPGPDAEDRRFIAALTDFQASEAARILPPGPARRNAKNIINGYQRAFVGDAAADALQIPDTRFKHLPRATAPLRIAAFTLHDRLVPHGKARRTARGFRHRTAELTRMRTEHDVTHNLVDEVPVS